MRVCAERLAGFDRGDTRNSVLAFAQQGRGVTEDAAAPVRRECLPGFERGGGRFECRVEIRRRRVRELGQYRLGGRIEHGPGRAARAVEPAPADQ